LTPDVHHCSVLSNLHISSRKGSLFVPSSFRGIFLTEARFFLFPAILVAQLLMGAMGNTPPIWVWCLGTFSAVILSCWILYSVWGPGFCTSTQGLHSCIPLLSVRVSSLCSPGPSLCLTKHGIRAFVFLFEFFIAQKS
jgi:hypothetical protein